MISRLSCHSSYFNAYITSRLPPPNSTTTVYLGGQWENFISLLWNTIQIKKSFEVDSNRDEVFLFYRVGAIKEQKVKKGFCDHLWFTSHKSCTRQCVGLHCFIKCSFMFHF
jgi:hypothetical protein